ncbi:MAG: chemotaxis protein CheD [Nitrospirae bacterium]|nr:chemotaxis protein CheD [Nitrospirota bacterium]
MSNGKSIDVRLGEWKATKESGAVLVIDRIGAGVGIVVIDLVTHICGGAHCILPESPSKDLGNAGKFTNMAVPAIVEELLKLGAQKGKMVAKIAGGAQMLSQTVLSDRNVGGAREALRKIPIPVTGEDVGGKFIRSLQVNSTSGEVLCLRLEGAQRTQTKL